MARFWHSCSNSAMNSEPPSTCTSPLASPPGQPAVALQVGQDPALRADRAELTLALQHHRRLVLAPARKVHSLVRISLRIMRLWINMYTKTYIYSENPRRVAQAVQNAAFLAMRP